MITPPRMPDRLLYGSEGNWLLEQLLLNDARHRRDLERPEAERPFPPGEHLFGYLLPEWQRPPVWTRAQQIRFIESCYLGFDVGRFLLARHTKDHLWDQLIDGQQRLTALRDYLAGAFPVFGARWTEISEEDRRKFMRLHLPFSVIDADRLSEAQLIDLYTRLNYGGTPHAPEHHPNP